MQHRIPERLSDRVFILGALTEPENLKSAGLGSYKTIGKAISKDCREETDTLWGHDLLRPNASEISRLREHVRPILFQPTCEFPRLRGRPAHPPQLLSCPIP